MGLMDLFSKDGRESIMSKLDYDGCYKARQLKLLSYRKNAAQEILLNYPDARLLLNHLDRRFMVALPSQGRLLIGQFADDYYPRLDYVGESDSSEKRRAAIAKFRHQISRCVGNISKESMPKFKSSSFLLSDSVTNTFKTKGYAITGRAELKYLVGGALFLNQRQIARASIWDPKPKGYFNAKLFAKIVQNTDYHPGIQVLTFVTTDCNPIGEGQKMSYEIIFDRSIHHFDKDNRSEFADSIVNLRDFLYVLENYFRPDCLGKDDDQIEYTDPSNLNTLASADRDEEQSIESRYRF